MNNPPAPPVTGFFRVGTRQDSDGDGLPDAYESMVSQTAANRRDTDSDGLWDRNELWMETDFSEMETE